MAKNYFLIRSSTDLEDVYQSVILWFKGKQYEVEGVKKQDFFLIQARKTGMIRTFFGTNLAFKIKIYLSDIHINTQPEFIVETTRGKWIQNIAGAGFAGLFTSGFTVLTGIAGAGWSFLLENELISYLENDLQFSRVKPDTIEQPIPTTSSTTSSSSTTINLTKNNDQQQIITELEAEINRLEIAFTDEILTEEEFTRKKAVLEQKIDDYEISFVIEEKIKKLQEAFSQGILDQTEYEEKVQEIETKLRDKIIQQRSLERNKIKIIKLKEALNSGIITQEEYQQKIESLS